MLSLVELRWQDFKDCQGVFHLSSDPASRRLRVICDQVLVNLAVSEEKPTGPCDWGR